MNQNRDYNYDGGGATYSRPDTGAHESKCQKNRPGIPGQPPPALPHLAPIPGRDIFLFCHIMHRHPSCIGIPRRTLSVSHVLIIHIIAGKIKLIFEF